MAKRRSAGRSWLQIDAEPGSKGKTARKRQTAPPAKSVDYGALAATMQRRASGIDLGQGESVWPHSGGITYRMTDEKSSAHRLVILVWNHTRPLLEDQLRYALTQRAYWREIFTRTGFRCFRLRVDDGATRPC